MVSVGVIGREGIDYLVDLIEGQISSLETLSLNIIDSSSGVNAVTRNPRIKTLRFAGEMTDNETFFTTQLWNGEISFHHCRVQTVWEDLQLPNSTEHT